MGVGGGGCNQTDSSDAFNSIFKSDLDEHNHFVGGIFKTDFIV